MKTTILMAAALCLIFFSCENATNPLEPATNLQPAMAQSDDALEISAARAAKVSVCHLDEYGNYITINISENAFPAHLAHGDMLLPVVTGAWIFTYIWDLYGTRAHDIDFDLGTGGYPAQGSYTYYEIVNTAIVQCDGVEFEFEYVEPGRDVGDIITASGGFNGDGTMSGVATVTVSGSTSNGTWTAAQLP